MLDPKAVYLCLLKGGEEMLSELMAMRGAGGEGSEGGGEGSEGGG